MLLGSTHNFTVAAGKLNVHRQTLVYRLKSIEALTGTYPTSTEGTMRFWYALEAARPQVDSGRAPRSSVAPTRRALGLATPAPPPALGS